MTILNNKIMIEELYKKCNNAFSELNRWKKLSIDERADVLQSIENFTAMKYGRSPAIVRIDRSLSKTTNGYYDTDNNIIVQNYRCIREKTPDISVKNILHEGRHAYQYDCVQNPEKHKEILESTRRQWKSNFESYNLPQKGMDFQAYFQQPLETDARNFANKYYMSYINGDVIAEETKKANNKENTGMWNFKSKDKQQTQSTQSNQSNQQNKNSNTSTNDFRERLKLSPEDQKKQMEVVKRWNSTHSNTNSNSNSNTNNSNRGERTEGRDCPSHGHRR